MGSPNNVQASVDLDEFSRAMVSRGTVRGDRGAPQQGRSPSMFMAVMHIRIMRVGMLDGFVNVRVGMRFVSAPGRIVLMQVMGIVNMRMFVLQR
jgi:isoprenylcysteine carboxyl methyltransferase (ICMT) family protein YpbQ